MGKKQQQYEAMLLAAKASESAKSEFFAKMGHEIHALGLTTLTPAERS